MAKPRRAEAGLRGRPAEGLLVLFPSWLSHSVTRLADDGAAGERIAVAFNVHGAEV